MTDFSLVPALMKPLLLVSPSTLRQGREFSDFSLNLSECYCQAVIAAGGLPIVLSCSPSIDYLAESVSRCDGVLLTGGEDIGTEVYAPDLARSLAAKVKETEPERDLMEALLIREIFRQRKPLLAICRGQQLLNVVFGGTLIVDIPTQRPDNIGHRHLERKNEPVHQIEIVAGSLLASLLGTRRTGVNSTHHQAIDTVAPSFRAVATAPDGIVEAIELHSRARKLLPWFLGVQFHPERLIPCHPMFLSLFKAFVDAGKRVSREGGRPR